MRKSTYVIAMILILSAIVMQVILISLKETLTLRTYMTFGFLSYFGLIFICGVLSGLFGGKNISGILAVNIIAVLVVNLVLLILEPLFLTEDVKRRLLEEAERMNIQLTLGKSLGNFISGFMIGSLLIAIASLIGFKISNALMKKSA